ncbi:hypothetical protein M407DRAFT_32520 [Tulasnella calospora MUT 4182]|uniref:Protein kinase domain-containing protein n=1 Tax=Tulasnella calospora MUT 4182 TaxID=1051891 RepID=A0A0C3Q4K5_9AGAM|nr:hypothetical protein M407DRAFT_32520 [Tulasnella calospora MUT 4182]
MSNLPFAGEEDEKSSPKLDVPPLTEEPHTSQEKGMDETHSRTRVDPGESKTVKLHARDLLATLSGMRISTTEIEFIGNGYQAAGTYANVAVATLVKVFVNELRLLDKLSHPNIAKIIGFVEDVEKSIAWLVFPWEDNGNLREFLRSGTWEIPERVLLIFDVACGLEYLHSRQPPVCHGDLKSVRTTSS